MKQGFLKKMVDGINENFIAPRISEKLIIDLLSDLYPQLVSDQYFDEDLEFIKDDVNRVVEILNSVLSKRPKINFIITYENDAAPLIKRDNIIKLPIKNTEEVHMTRDLKKCINSFYRNYQKKVCKVKKDDYDSLSADEQKEIIQKINNFFKEITGEIDMDHKCKIVGFPQAKAYIMKYKLEDFDVFKDKINVGEEIDENTNLTPLERINKILMSNLTEESLNKYITKPSADESDELSEKEFINFINYTVNNKDFIENGYDILSSEDTIKKIVNKVERSEIFLLDFNLPDYLSDKYMTFNIMLKEMLGEDYIIKSRKIEGVYHISVSFQKKLDNVKN